jgi:hypothetical protein
MQNLRPASRAMLDRAPGPANCRGLGLPSPWLSSGALFLLDERGHKLSVRSEDFQPWRHFARSSRMLQPGEIVSEPRLLSYTGFVRNRSNARSN